ncbi:MAG: hypothetical protein IT162_16460 [Bryobacterales bacterium]|nr:hypothetical protein [Bryobacterales bacterium]
MGEKRKQLRFDSGAVIVDDGSPFLPTPSGSPKSSIFGINATTFSLVGITEGGKSHTLQSLITNYVVVRYRGTEVVFDWDMVKKVRLETSADRITAELTKSTLKITVRKKFRTGFIENVYFSTEGGSIKSIKVEFVNDGGKLEIKEKEDFDGGVSFDFSENSGGSTGGRTRRR